LAPVILAPAQSTWTVSGASAAFDQDTAAMIIVRRPRRPRYDRVFLDRGEARS
jgi:hypothetical protein